MGRFVVKTDHNILKYFLNQEDLNERQQKWVNKLQGYDFNIEYVKGKKNIVVDAFLGGHICAPFQSYQQIGRINRMIMPRMHLLTTFLMGHYRMVSIR